MQALLKDMEIAFVSFEEDTPEKEFCKADMQTAVTGCPTNCVWIAVPNSSSLLSAGHSITAHLRLHILHRSQGLAR